MQEAVAKHDDDPEDALDDRVCAEDEPAERSEPRKEVTS